MDAKECGNGHKRGVRKGQKLQRITNERLHATLEILVETVDNMRNEIEELKIKTGSRDVPVAGKPERKNYNDDPGPWKKKKIDIDEVDKAVEEYRENLLNQILKRE